MSLHRGWLAYIPRVVWGDFDAMRLSTFFLSFSNFVHGVALAGTWGAWPGYNEIEWTRLDILLRIVLFLEMVGPFGLPHLDCSISGLSEHDPISVHSLTNPAPLLILR